MSPRLKMAVVGILSCLTLMLGLFTSTGIASAHSTSALQSQSSASAVAKDNRDRRCVTFIIRRQRFRHREDDFFFMNGQMFDRPFFRNFERRIFITICHGRRFERSEDFSLG